MTRSCRFAVPMPLALLLFLSPVAGAEAPPIPRILPPKGIEIPAEKKEALASRLATLEPKVATLANEQDVADVAIYLKAVRYALENGEFFAPRDVEAAGKLLDEAQQRLAGLQAGKRNWATQTGPVVRGYRSALDESIQPYGLEIPENIDLAKPQKLYVWLHGRGDTMTDLQFVHQRMTRKGTVAPNDGIIVHPFGRYCNAFKFAGEVDVLETIQSVSQNYSIDPDRIVLWGFSMGGAGVWHLAAHHPDKWVAASPGAGFAETRRYQNLKPENYPVGHEQTLWNLFDVPSYTRNLFNLPIIAYSGENDKQIQAARVMEEAFQEQGRTLRHLIGPGMGHKYHPDTLKQLTTTLGEYSDKGLDRFPKKVTLQTRTLRYNKVFWVTVLGLAKHWEDSRVDAELSGPKAVSLATKSVTALQLTPFTSPGKEIAAGTMLTVDGQQLTVAEPADTVTLFQKDGQWRIGTLPEQTSRKIPGLQGPIDDVFMTPFLVVTPEGKGTDPRIDTWVAGELAHFRDRWRRLFRGELREKPASKVTQDDMDRFHLILWGDHRSNPLIARVLPGLSGLKWDTEVQIGSTRVDASRHVPVMIARNPLATGQNRYVVLNSGMTFREAHDRTNSLQNPKLPDWAIIDVTVPASATAPGKVIAAGFFDEFWRAARQ